MAVEVLGTMKTANPKIPVAMAEDIEMPDGKRLSDVDFSSGQSAPPVVPGEAILQPDKFYTFGTVSTLSVALADAEEDVAHEYCFEFDAADDFHGFVVSPSPRWVLQPQIEPGKTYQVSILRGIGVMICA